MDLLITGQLLLPDPREGVRLTPGTVTVRADRIASITDGLHPRPDFGGPDHLICPGFVDTHVHLPQFDSIGIDGLELLDWLSTSIFPAEAKWADSDYAETMSRRVARELLQPLCDRPPVHRLERERLEDQEVERTSDDVVRRVRSHWAPGQ